MRRLSSPNSGIVVHPASLVALLTVVGSESSPSRLRVVFVSCRSCLLWVVVVSPRSALSLLPLQSCVIGSLFLETLCCFLSYLRGCAILGQCISVCCRRSSASVVSESVVRIPPRSASIGGLRISSGLRGPISLAQTSCFQHVCDVMFERCAAGKPETAGHCPRVTAGAPLVVSLCEQCASNCYES